MRIYILFEGCIHVVLFLNVPLLELFFVGHFVEAGLDYHPMYGLRHHSGRDVRQCCWPKISIVGL